MSGKPTEWLNPVFSINRLASRMGAYGMLLAEPAVTSAMLSPTVRKRGVPSFGLPYVRDIPSDSIPLDASADPRLAEILNVRGKMIWSRVEIEQNDLDSYAAAYHDIRLPEPAGNPLPASPQAVRPKEAKNIACELAENFLHGPDAPPIRHGWKTKVAEHVHLEIQKRRMDYGPDWVRKAIRETLQHFEQEFERHSKRPLG